MTKKYLKIGLGFLLVCVVIFILNTLYAAGVFTTLAPHVDGQIETTYTNTPGAEDMDIDYSKGLLFISSTDRWKQLQGEEVEGGVYLLQLDSGKVPTKIPTTYTGKFRPHGISFLTHESTDYLFVVNHNDLGNFVELFQFKNDTLFYQRSYSNESMCCPNDVVGVSPTQFYVTNDHGTQKGVLRNVEDYLRVPLSYLLYFDGTKFSKAYEGLTYGNGVNISNDGSKLYLTHTTGRELLTFSRDTQTGTLKLLDKLNLKSGLDNISVDEDDNLWIASHPKMLKFVGHAKDATKKSPSQIFKLTPEANDGYLVKEVFLNEGEIISASSIGIHYKNQLLIGGVFESKVVRLTFSEK
jgi:arylesterase/paraoxonase